MNQVRVEYEGRAGQTLRPGGDGWSRADRAKAAAKLMLGWVALLWLIEAVEYATGQVVRRANRVKPATAR